MHILLAPSETKTPGGTKGFKLENLSFNELFSARKQAYDEYCKLLKSGDEDAIRKLTGLKKGDLLSIASLDASMCAISRYTGVAYDYLDYASLDDSARKYLQKHLLIFSNLFGIVRACDLLPNYKLKQGEKIGAFDSTKHYKIALKPVLDEYLSSGDILDLRAEFYDKFYIPSRGYYSLKFLRDDKVLSHMAKAYRGLVLRHLAQNNCANFSEFLELKIKGLKFKQAQKCGLKTTYIFEVCIN